MIDFRTLIWRRASSLSSPFRFPSLATYRQQPPLWFELILSSPSPSSPPLQHGSASQVSPPSSPSVCASSPLSPFPCFLLLRLPRFYFCLFPGSSPPMSSEPSPPLSPDFSPSCSLSVSPLSCL